MSFASVMNELEDGHRTEDGYLAEYGRVIGIDEAGRGAFAGPMHVAGCLLTEEALEKDWASEVDDSKNLTVRRRRQVAAAIKEKSAAWAVAACEPWTIDEHGLCVCLMSAFSLIARRLAQSGDLVAFDGKRVPDGLGLDTVAVAAGDRRFVSIGAASILAKTARDSYMVDLKFEYPGFGFDDNSGYGTGDHRLELGRRGPTPVHRLSVSGVGQPDTGWECRSEEARQTLSETAEVAFEDPEIYLLDAGGEV